VLHESPLTLLDETVEVVFKHAVERGRRNEVIGYSVFQLWLIIKDTVLDEFKQVRGRTLVANAMLVGLVREQCPI